MNKFFKKSTQIIFETFLSYLFSNAKLIGLKLHAIALLLCHHVFVEVSTLCICAGGHCAEQEAAATEKENWRRKITNSCAACCAS